MYIPFDKAITDIRTSLVLDDADLPTQPPKEEPQDFSGADTNDR